MKRVVIKNETVEENRKTTQTNGMEEKNEKEKWRNYRFVKISRKLAKCRHKLHTRY
jgi:hypothetical protein